MAYSTQRATSDGTMAYLDLSIQYMKRADINVFYNGLPANPATWSWVGTTDKRIAFSPLVANGVEVLVKRTTQINSIINVFANGAKFNNATMDQDFTQLLYLNQEAVEGAALTDIFNDVDFHGYKIKNLGVAVDDTDAITFGQVKTLSNGAYTSAQAAAASASDALGYKNLAQDWASKLTTTVDGSSYSAKQYALNAASSATAASGSASSASSSAGTATSQAAAAAGSASAANTSKLDAQAAQTAAETARDTAQSVAADVLDIQQNAQDAIDIANTFDSRLTTAEGDASSALTQATAATLAAGLATVGQCRFDYVSATQCKLARFNGKYLMVNGAAVAIPSAGVVISNSGLSGATLYYAYAYVLSGVLTLEFSTTTHTVDTSTGVRIKTGDATRTLVGAVFTTSASQFEFAYGANLGVMSWFNRKAVSSAFNPVTGATNTSSTSLAVIGGSGSTMAWSNEYVDAIAIANFSNNTAATINNLGSYINGALQAQAFYMVPSANFIGNVQASARQMTVSDGRLLLQVGVSVSSGIATVNSISVKVTVWI